MDKTETFRRFGLFDAKVPRYTSYPPANRFEVDVGRRNQPNWLAAVPPDAPLSLYVHIPFCRRLCWFCACRTQGTRTLGPLDGYIETLAHEVSAAAEILPARRSMSRLHLGGGTPTLLSAAQMRRLLEMVFDRFPRAEDFEFSVEIDPTEAGDAVLAELTRWGISRASIGVQDFDPAVQRAIGRTQTVDETRRAMDHLRRSDVGSVNFDLLYGLPHQTEATLLATLEEVARLRPDRIALYGYAHVPHVSKRQAMIDDEALPSPETRYALARAAGAFLAAEGYRPLGIDHYALESDSLYTAAQAGRLRRNFQGYTDDVSDTLIGFGASAISKFNEGYVHNAVSTKAYLERIAESGLAGHKGYRLSAEDRIISDMIGMVMCDFHIDAQRLLSERPCERRIVQEQLATIAKTYGPAVRMTPGHLRINPGYEPIARLIAVSLDSCAIERAAHSLAV